MSLLSPARAPSSAQGCPGDVIQPYTRRKGREGTPGWLYLSLATGNRLETEWEVLLIYGARLLFLKGLGFHFPPKKMFAGASLWLRSVLTSSWRSQQVFLLGTHCLPGGRARPTHFTDEQAGPESSRGTFILGHSLSGLDRKG